MRTLRAALYLRISRDVEHTGLGVARQEKECRELVARLGWKIVKVYSDNDISAHSNKKLRHGYLAMLDDVRNEYIDAVVCWHPDRLYRQPRELEDLIDLIEEHHVQIATVTAGEIDLSTASGRMNARLHGAINRGEGERKSERLKSKMRELAEAGHRLGGGSRPFGYDRVFEGEGAHRRIMAEPINEAEAEIIRECAKRALGGEGLYSICGDLNDRGVKTSQGGLWRIGTLRPLLRSGRIAGLSEYKGEIVGKAVDWEPIISIEDHERLRSLLANPSDGKRRKPRARKTPKHLLSGLVYCGACGTRMVGTGSKEQPSFACSTSDRGCGKRTIRIDYLDPAVTELLFAYLDTIEEDPADDEALVRELEEKIAGWERKVEELAAEYDDGDMSAREMRLAGDRLRAKISGAYKEIAELGVRRTIEMDVEELRRAWNTDAFGLDRRRSIVSALIEKIVIHRHTGNRRIFDPSRVEIKWR